MRKLHYLSILWICMPSFLIICHGMLSENLALNKRATMSAAYWAAKNGNDGNKQTRAKTYKLSFNYFYVDLEEKVNVTYIFTKLESLNGTHIGVINKKPRYITPSPAKACLTFNEDSGETIHHVECGGIVGRYVVIYTWRRVKLMIYEVEVYNTTDFPNTGNRGVSEINLARNKTSNLSYTDGNSEASYVNDGNFINGVKINKDASVSFWYIDLEKTYEKLHILLYMKGIWSNLDVGISDEPPTLQSERGTNYQLCAEYNGSYGYKVQFSEVICGSPGRYAILFRRTSGNLTIFEVEVYDILAKDCGIVPWLLNDNVLNATYPEGTLYGSEATIHCKEGFIPSSEGSTSTKCSNKGIWDPIVKCISKDCGRPPKWQNALADASSGTKYQSVATIDCDKGYQHSTNSSKSTKCLASGKWEPVIVDCQQTVIATQKQLDTSTIKPASFTKSTTTSSPDEPESYVWLYISITVAFVTGLALLAYLASWGRSSKARIDKEVSRLAMRDSSMQSSHSGSILEESRDLKGASEEKPQTSRGPNESRGLNEPLGHTVSILEESRDLKGASEEKPQTSRGPNNLNNQGDPNNLNNRGKKAAGKLNTGKNALGRSARTTTRSESTKRLSSRTASNNLKVKPAKPGISAQPGKRPSSAGKSPRSRTNITSASIQNISKSGKGKVISK